MATLPFRVLNRNFAPVSKISNETDIAVDKLNNLKLGQDQAGKAVDSKAFRSKIPVLTSRINPNIQLPKANAVEKPSKPANCSPKISCKPINIKSEIIPVPIENIDSDANCFVLSDYAPEIYKYLHSLEKAQAVKANFLAENNLLTANMRAVLINWLIGVHRSFRLTAETLYLCVSIVDRFLATERVEKSQLQLLGAAAFFVASKFEEVYYPDVKDLATICDNIYSKKDILRMEMRILKVLDFQLSGPSSLYFLRRGSKAAHADSRVHMIGKYLCELSLIEYQCAHWLPSLIAATSLYIALRLANNASDENCKKIEDSEDNQSVWTPTIQHYTGYSLKEVHRHAAVLCRLVITSETSKHQNCRKKYQSPKYMSISNFSPNSMKIIKKLSNP